MKILVCESPRKISIKETKIPKIKENEILVKVKYCGICIYDLKRYLGLKDINYPVILGHEPSGFIVKTGKNVKGFRGEDKVVIDVKLKCGECINCKRGLESRCLISEASNGFSQYIAVPEENVFKISVDLISGVFTEPLACIIHGFRKIKNMERKSFLIIGDGIMGILAGFVGKVMKKGKVTLLGHHGNRLKMAKYINLDRVLNIKNGIPELEKFDFIIITVEEKEILNELKQFLLSGGNVLIIGELKDGFYKFNFNDIYSNEWFIIGSKGYSREDFKNSVEIIEKYSGILKNFISKIYNINELELGFNDLEMRKILKGVLCLDK